MKHGMRVLPAIAAGLLWSTQPVLAERQDCDKVSVPKNIEGQVIKVEPEQGKVSVRTSDGTTHEFQAAKETLQDYKAGDTIKANLRTAPKCERK